MSMRALVAAALAVASIVVAAVVLAARPRDPGSDALAATSVEGATLPQTLPFRYVAGHIVIDAALDGSDEPLGFILDSGAPTTFSEATATRFAGDAVGTVPVRSIDGSAWQADIVSVDMLRIGDTLFRDIAGIKGFVAADSTLACASEHGLIGANLLSTAVWQIDYAARAITIASSVEDLDHVDGAISLEFSTPLPGSRSPVIGLASTGGTLAYVIDTGSNGWLVSHPADLEAVGVPVDTAGPRIDLIATGIAGPFESSVTYAEADIALDGQTLADYPVATTETLRPGEGNLGNGFLEGFVVTLDWPDGRVYLDPVTPDGSIPRPPEPLAADLSWDGQNLIVGSIVPGSSAADAGLELGEAVVSVDGQDRSESSRQDFCKLEAGDPETAHTVTTAGGASYSLEPAAGFFDPLE